MGKGKHRRESRVILVKEHCHRIQHKLSIGKFRLKRERRWWLHDEDCTVLDLLFSSGMWDTWSFAWLSVASQQRLQQYESPFKNILLGMRQTCLYLNKKQVFLLSTYCRQCIANTIGVYSSSWGIQTTIYSFWIYLDLNYLEGNSLKKWQVIAQETKQQVE